MLELLSVTTAVPPRVLSQEEFKTFLPFFSGPGMDRVRAGDMVDSTRIRTRHIVLPPDRLLALGGTAQRCAEYAVHAGRLAEEACRGALGAAGVAPADVTRVIAVSCTGHTMPSLDAHLIERLGIDPAVRRLPIMQLGCSAGVAALALGADLENTRSGTTLLVAVELCSLCIQTSDLDRGQLLGNMLFGDGAAAAVLGDGFGRGPRLLQTSSTLWPGTSHLLGMRLGDTGLRLVLSSELPRAVMRRLPTTLDAFLVRHGIARDAIAWWVVHPGGPRVLEAVGRALHLPEGALTPSWNVWTRYGNVSSATALFILRELHATVPPAAGSLGVMIAFGPGLTCELALLEADGWLSRV